jgi:hypothetical protein
MPLSIYQASIPVLIRGLEVLSTLLEKGSAHAATKGLDPATLVMARLAPDMLPLSGQVQRASDTSKFAAERLTGVPAPRFEDKEVTFEELQARIRATLAYLRTIEPGQMEGSEIREVVVATRDSKWVFRGDSYLLTFALPNFFFHITTAYDILRQNGVVIGKRDYLGPFDAQG